MSKHLRIYVQTDPKSLADLTSSLELLYYKIYFFFCLSYYLYLYYTIFVSKEKKGRTRNRPSTSGLNSAIHSLYVFKQNLNIQKIINIIK